MQQRLHVFMAHTGIASRRQSEKMIAEGLVLVNDRPAQIGQSIDPTLDRISVSGRVLNQQQEKHTYVMMHKPAGVVSTTQDEERRKTVIDLLPSTFKQHRLYPVGRLDADSEGLILLTNDGELAYRLTHPKFEVAKIYWTLLDHQPSPAALHHLHKGVRLRDGWAKPLSVERVPLSQAPSEGQWWEMGIEEGRKHQVKRMWERTGYEVLRLLRVRLGSLRLGELAVGEARELSVDEVLALKADVKLLGQ